MQGRAMQAAWFEHLREAGVHWVEPPKRKKPCGTADRLEPEAHGLAQDRARLTQRADLAARLADVEAREEAILKAARIIEIGAAMNGLVLGGSASLLDRGHACRGRGRGRIVEQVELLLVLCLFQLPAVDELPAPLLGFTQRPEVLLPVPFPRDCRVGDATLRSCPSSALC